MPQDRVVRLEWDRRYLSVLGVENSRLYELRLQTPENVFVEEENELRQVMDSFRVNRVNAWSEETQKGLWQLRLLFSDVIAETLYFVSPNQIAIELYNFILSNPCLTNLTFLHSLIRKGNQRLTLSISLKQESLLSYQNASFRQTLQQGRFFWSATLLSSFIRSCFGSQVLTENSSQ